MKILYAPSGQHLFKSDFENKEAQLAWKEALQNKHLLKFCLFRRKGEDILFIFPFALRISTFALDAIKVDGLNLTRENFACGGNITEVKVNFDSASCEDVFGSNTPPEGVDATQIHQALANDNFQF